MLVANGKACLPNRIILVAFDFQIAVLGFLKPQVLIFKFSYEQSEFKFISANGSAADQKNVSGANTKVGTKNLKNLSNLFWNFSVFHFCVFLARGIILFLILFFVILITLFRVIF